MAVLGRILLNSAERVDLPDLLSLDSYAAGDWKYYLQSVVGETKPYVLSGFDVINPGNAIGLPTCSFRVADSIVYYPGSAAGPFFHGLPEGNEASAPLVPQLRTNATNYVYLTLTTFNTAVDTRALWDPDRNGGDGGEFTQDINTESVLQAQLNISTGSFPVNTVPLAIIVVGPSAIVSITDARDMLFRLGSGGIAPNPLNTFTFPSLPSNTYARIEPSGTTTSLVNPNPFQGGDKNIKTMKQWMDAIMTKIKEIGGTTYWYEDTTTYTLYRMWHDALATTWKSKGSYTHSSSVPGELSWSEDIYVKSPTSPVDIVIRSSGGPIVLDNNQVAFLELVRGQVINSLDQPVVFSTGTVTSGMITYGFINSATGAAGMFAELKKGDWIKKTSDKDTLFLQVREFYNTTQSPGPVSGTITNAYDARSITLSGPYLGVPSNPAGDRARFDRGEYDSSDIVIVDRNDPLLDAAGGNLMWFALRSDTIMPISTITTVSLGGSITFADGTGATVSSAAHGLIDGDRIQVTVPVAQAGIYTIDKIDNNNFTFKSADTTIGAFTGFYGLATTTADVVDDFQIESANHGFDSGESITISDTTNFDGSYDINVRSATQFQFPIGVGFATESAGFATLARMDVRSEEGVTKVVQGETIEIGSGTIVNMQAFVGMTALDQTSPVYNLPPSYGTFNNGANYNSSLTDNLTARVSKNTAMLMDKAQDKTIKYATNAVEATVVTDGGSPTLQNLSFTPSGSSLVILQPGSPGNATLLLPDSSLPLQLAQNQSVYVIINRNASSTPGYIIDNTSAVPVNENVFVLASRITGPEIYLWDGHLVLNTVPLGPSSVPLIECDYFDPISTTLPTGTVIVDSITITAGQTVVFGNLTVDPNRIHRALGVGPVISGWETLFKFDGSEDPSLTDTILIRYGQGFALQIGKFNGTNWVFNDYVRYFNGADYWEQSNLIGTTLADNTIAGTVFTTAWAGSEHIIVDFSIIRGSSRETGTLRIVTNGITAEVASDSSYVDGNSGVTFSASISGADLTLSYTTTSTGSPAGMKYFLRRWSSASGGPAGVPSYSGAPAVSTGAAAPVGALQFNSAGLLAGNSNFMVDTVDLSMNFNGLRQGVMSSPITILNNQVSFIDLFSMSTAYPFIVIEYSITKENFARVGHLQVAFDGVNVACNDSYVETGPTGVVIQAIFTTDIQFQYTSTNGAGLGAFKYAWRKWDSN